jgi:hypothetical protein
MKLLLIGLLACSLWGDARYKLAYRVKANVLIQLVAGLAGLNKLNSEGEEVILKGSQLKVRGEKTSMILDYATGKMVLIDHVEKTFERLRIEDMQKRIAADIPGPMVDGLKRLFHSDGGSIANDVKIERTGIKSDLKTLETFRAKHGLSYLLPAMESIVTLTPTLAKSINEVRKSGELAEALRIQIGANGKIVDALVEIRDYRETAVEDKEFLPPADYLEVI